jgi:hypothetical protein
VRSDLLYVRHLSCTLTSNFLWRVTQASIAMVSADNLNLDVLELIFAHLAGKDLASVALVSRSFLSGAIPRLYRTILFHLLPRPQVPFFSISHSSP